MVCIMASKEFFNFVSYDQTVFSKYFTGLSKCSLLNFKCVLARVFFNSGACVVSVETLVTAVFSTSFSSSPHVLHGCWTTLLIILFIPFTEILQGAPDHGRFKVK